VIVAVTRANQVLFALRVHKDADVAIVVGPKGAPQRRNPLVAQVVLAAIERRIPLTALEQDNTHPGDGQLLCDDTSAGARADHHRVDFL